MKMEWKNFYEDERKIKVIGKFLKTGIFSFLDRDEDDHISASISFLTYNGPGWCNGQGCFETREDVEHFLETATPTVSPATAERASEWASKALIGGAKAFEAEKKDLTARAEASEKERDEAVRGQRFYEERGIKALRGKHDANILLRTMAGALENVLGADRVGVGDHVTGEGFAGIGTVQGVTVVVDNGNSWCYAQSSLTPTEQSAQHQRAAKALAAYKKRGE